MITAHDSPAEIDEAFHWGADYFITKPFNSATIKQLSILLNDRRPGK
jgi:DNA-binding response OmpR family regulator